MEDEKDADRFHDSEEEDVYDLYNACNGVMDKEHLDVNKLKELSEEELRLFNVERLVEIWRHTTSGCLECEGIIRTLNSARGMVQVRVEEPAQERVLIIDANYSEIS